MRRRHISHNLQVLGRDASGESVLCSHCTCMATAWQLQALCCNNRSATRENTHVHASGSNEYTLFEKRIDTNNFQPL